jgi:hypothetical protein
MFAWINGIPAIVISQAVTLSGKSSVTAAKRASHWSASWGIAGWRSSLQMYSDFGSVENATKQSKSKSPLVKLVATDSRCESIISVLVTKPVSKYFAYNT